MLDRLGRRHHHDRHRHRDARLGRGHLHRQPHVRGRRRRIAHDRRHRHRRRRRLRPGLEDADQHAPRRSDAGGPYSGSEGSGIALSGTVTDPDSTPTLLWTYTRRRQRRPGRRPARSRRRNAASTTFTCTDDGTYTVKLTADDGINTPVSSTATVTVANANPSVTDHFAGGRCAHARHPDHGLGELRRRRARTTRTRARSTGATAPPRPAPSARRTGAGTCTGTHTYISRGRQPHADGHRHRRRRRPGLAHRSCSPSTPRRPSRRPRPLGHRGLGDPAQRLGHRPGLDADAARGRTRAGPDVDPGATCTFSVAHAAATTITCTDDGTFTVTLTADDGSNPPVSRAPPPSPWRTRTRS